MKTLFLILLFPMFLTAQDCEMFIVQHQSPQADITYGVVQFQNHCWITQNLGAEHQATKFNAGETGWYFQFNRKQAYTGTTANWVNYIEEYSEWLPENDPCQDLGEGWRLPTYWEMVAADLSWANADRYAFKSPLKLHDAGRLNYNNGVQSQIGANGYYWTSSQSVFPSHGRALGIVGNNSAVGIQQKAMGATIRCLR